MTQTFNKIWIIVALLANGAAIMVLEILGTRIVAPYFGTTLYVWTAMIVITLLALAMGYFFGGRLADRKPSWKIFYSLFFTVSVLFLIIPLIDNAILKMSGSLGIMWGPLLAALLLFFLPLGILGMISPFAVRLNIKEVEQVGRTVGNFYAISTAGSIVGALLVAYFLIPNIKINIIIIGASVCLFLVGAVWMLKQKRGGHTTAISSALVVLMLILGLNQQPVSAALEEARSFYGDIRVEIIATDITCIMVNNIPQSCFNLDLDGSAYSYIKLMARGLEQIGNPQKVLVIGDGGGLITREVLRNTEVYVDALDIDQKIFDLGKQYLYFEDSHRVNKIVADGRNFLRESNEEYDIIMVDAFTDSSPAGHLFTQEFFELAKDKMSNEGVLVINAFGFNKGEGIEAMSSIYQTLVSVFDDVYISPAGDANQESRGFFNFIMFASDSDLDRIGRIFELDTDDNIPIITDNYNPLEYYSLPSSEELIKLYIFEEDE